MRTVCSAAMASCFRLTLAYTFLPFGNRSPPQSSLCADAALAVPHTARAALLSQLHALQVEVVASEVSPSHLLVRTSDTSALERLAAEHDGRLAPIDAGPFATLDEAAELMQAWLTSFWQCHSLESGGNSCFEFGGCHRCCWWRGAIGRCELRLEQLSDAVAGDESPTPEPGAALRWLQERAAADAAGAFGVSAVAAAADDGSGGGDDGGLAPLVLRGSLVSLGGLHYCALRPAEPGVS